MAQNYTRQSSFDDGDTITASLFNNEFNQIVNALAYSASSDSSTGHKHDGNSGQGGNIPQIGDIDFLNKIVVDGTNNRWGFFVQVGGVSVEQIRVQDGAIVPVTDSDIDLGTSSLEFKDLFLDGTAHIDTLDVDADATVAGTLGVTGNTTVGGTLGVTGVLTGTSLDISGNVDIDGVTNLDVVDIDGAVDMASTLTVTGVLTGTSLDISGNVDVDGVTNLDVVDIDGAVNMATTLIVTGNVDFDGDLDVDGTTNLDAVDIDGAVNMATTLAVEGNVDFNGDLDVDGTIEFDAISGTGAVTVTNILDEDNMSSDSATALATQQSIKAYVDAQQDTVDTFGEVLALSNTTAGTDISVSTDDKVQFRDAAIYINSSVDGQLDIVADTEIQIAATTIDIDGAINASGEIIAASLDISGDVDVDGTTNLDIVDIDGAVNMATTALVTGVLTTTATQVATGGITSGSNIVSDTDSTDDLGTTSVRWANLFVDSITATDQITATGFTGTLDGILGSGAAAAATVTTLDTSGAVNLNLITDSSSSTSGALIVDGGVGIAKKLYVGTDLDVDGTTNLDVVDIDGAVQLDATLTIGANDQGYDVILYGDTASANVTWDTSADDLIFNGGAGLIVPDGQLTLASTAVTSTAAELNILDGVTSTAAELNILDGVTSTAAELNILDGVTSTAAELNILDGVTSTAAELNALDGITAVVGELNALDLGSTAVGTAIASKAVILDSNKDYTGVRNFSITGNLSVGGTTTVVDTVTMNAQNAVLFEGATADAHETTLTIVDPTADRTINLPNQSGTLPLLAAASNTAITSTPEELNILDGVTSTAAELNALDGITAVVGELNALDIGSTAVGTAVASKAVILDSNKDYTGIRNLTISGELDGGSLDISGDADIDGTTNLDIVDIDGAVDMASTALVTGVLTTTATQVATGGITSGSDIISDTDSTDSLGSTSVRWLKGWFDTLTAGTLTIGSGSVTDSSGAISFGNENLSTTGTLASGNLAVTGTLGTTGTIRGGGGFTVPNNSPLRGETTSGGTARMLRMSSSNVIEVGATSQVMDIFASTANVSGALIVDGNISGPNSILMSSSTAEVIRVTRTGTNAASAELSTSAGYGSVLLTDASGTGQKIKAFGSELRFDNGSTTLMTLNTASLAVAGDVSVTKAGNALLKSNSTGTSGGNNSALVLYNEGVFAGQFGYRESVNRVEIWSINGSLPTMQMDVSNNVVIPNGNLTVGGALSKGSGSFRIDHPLKPETHELVHSFTESPQADLLYSGTSDLIDGAAEINLDEFHGMTEGTFVALNRNIRVFTTNETDWEPIKGSVTGNILSISCQDASCSDKVSWLVIGERQDQHMMDTDWTDEQGRVIVEPLKPEEPETPAPVQRTISVPVMLDGEQVTSLETVEVPESIEVIDGVAVLTPATTEEVLKPQFEEIGVVDVEGNPVYR